MLNKKEGFIKKYMDYRVNGGKYEKISLLGEGGTSQVFLDTKLDTAKIDEIYQKIATEKTQS